MPDDLVGRGASLNALDELAASGVRSINVFGVPGVGKHALTEAWRRSNPESNVKLVISRARDTSHKAALKVEPFADDDVGRAYMRALILSRVDPENRSALERDYSDELDELAHRSEGLPAVCLAFGEQLRLLAPAEALRRFDELGAERLLPTAQFWGGFPSLPEHLRDALLALTAFPTSCSLGAALDVVSASLGCSEELAETKLLALTSGGFLQRTDNEGAERVRLVPTVRFDETVASGAILSSARRAHARHYLEQATADLDDARWSQLLFEDRAHLRQALWRATSDTSIAKLATQAQADRNTLILALPPEEQMRWARSLRTFVENEGLEASIVHALLNEELVLRHGGLYQDAAALLVEAERMMRMTPNAWTEARALRARLAHVRRPGGELAFLLGKTSQVADMVRDKPHTLSQMLPVAAWSELLVADDPEGALKHLDRLDDLQGPTVISRLARSTVLLEAQRYDETRAVAEAVVREEHPALRTFHLRMNRVLADVFEGIDCRGALDALCQEAQQRRLPIEGWIRVARATMASQTLDERLDDLRSTFKSSGVSDPVPVARAACLRLLQPDGPPSELLAASTERGVARRWCAAMGRAASNPERQRFLLRLAQEPLGIRTNGEPHTTPLCERSSAVRLIAALSTQSAGELPEAWTVTFAPDDLSGTQRRAVEYLRLAWALEPGLGVDVPPLFEWTWMEAVHDLETAANRTRVLIAKLRKEGWRQRLPATRGGYFLSVPT